MSGYTVLLHYSRNRFLAESDQWPEDTKVTPCGPTLDFNTLLVAPYEDDMWPFLLGLFLFYFSCGAIPAALPALLLEVPVRVGGDGVPLDSV